MNIFWNLQSKIKQSRFGLMGFVLIVYFGFHAINGDRGLFKMFYLKKEIAQAEKIAQGYQKQKQELERQVRLLSSASLDLDLLEERARVVLNYSAEDEFVLLDEL